MVRRSSAVTLLPLLVVAAVAGSACLGEDVVPGADPGPIVDASTPDTATPTGDDAATPADAGPTCPTGLADCDGDPKNGCETDTRTSAQHCGVCKRACGGSARCVAGACETEKLASWLTKAFSLEVVGPRLLWLEPQMVRGCTAESCESTTAIMVDVNLALTPVTTAPHQLIVQGSKFYFSQCGPSTQDCGIASCEVTGCKLTNATFVVPGVPSNRRPTAIGGGVNVIYTHHGLEGAGKWDLVAKTFSGLGVSYGINDQVQALWGNASRFVFLDPDTSLANPVGGVFSCPITGCTGARVPIVPPPVRHLAVANDVAYTTVNATTGQGAGASTLVACGLGGCGGAGKVLAKAQAWVSDIVADDKDVYWTTIGAASPDANAAAVGTVMRCKLPDCDGGQPVKIADAVVNPVGVRLDATHVYWITYGSGGAANGAIYRQRR